MEDSSTSNGQDLISKLPDSLLCHILSFLSPKESVGTSILSKRWENLWTSVPNLCFCDTFIFDNGNYVNKVKCFIEFVNWVLSHRDGFAIRNCNLSCYTSHASAHLYSWTCAVIACKVQELTLKSELFRVGQLPWSLLTCKTLVVLKIHGRFMFNFPTYVCLPRLKVLHLNSVIYGDDDSMQKLFSSCPVLEDLVIKRHDWDGVGIMNIYVPSLKRLSIFSLSLRHVGNYEYKVVIKAPNLEYLEIDDHMYEDYSVNSSPSLIEACVQGVCVFGLLKGISHVKRLALSGNAMQSLAPLYDLPTFHNLTDLKLGMDDNVGWKLLPNLLQSSPNLKVLVFMDVSMDFFFSPCWDGGLIPMGTCKTFQQRNLSIQLESAKLCASLPAFAS
uniref:F-box domain-containing protein n=1 Tax=Fagus sylvatica TaxID=28930 RepID=A0A2N9I8T0_FAGSY